MFDLKIVQNVIWFGTAGLEVLVLVMAARKRLYSTLPWFCVYFVTEVLRDIVIAPLAFSSKFAYFYAYWLGEALAGILGLLVIFEVYRQVFLQYASIQRLTTLLFGWATLVLIVITAASAFAIGGAEKTPIVAGIFAFARSVRLLQAGLLLLLFLLSRALGLNWRHYVAGVALGFAVLVATDLMAVTVRAHLGRAEDAGYVLLKPIAYAIAVLIWLAYVALPAPNQVVLIPDRKYLKELRRWNEALEGVLQ